MTEDDPRVGQLYSHVYNPKLEPRIDHPRWRRRLGAFVEDECWQALQRKIRTALRVELGEELPLSENHRDFALFFESAPLHTLLDAITVIFRTLSDYDRAESRLSRWGIHWRNFVARAMHEEAIAYTVDVSCGVRNLVDPQFERSRESTIAGLNEPRHAAVREALECAYSDYLASPQDLRGALGQIFEAVEILVRSTTGVPRLTESNLNQKLRELARNQFNDSSFEDSVVDNLVRSFGAWVTAMHNYRHGQPGPERAVPPAAVVVHALDSGAAFIRWILTFKALADSPSDC